MTVTAFLLLVAAAPAAAPDSVTAENVLEAHRKEFDARLGLKCPRDGEDADIVVCGRRPEDGPGGGGFRVPYKAEAGRRIPGEASFDGGGCMRLCAQPVMIPLHKIPSFIRRVKEALED
jgi:hypothetical protein